VDSIVCKYTELRSLHTAVKNVRMCNSTKVQLQSITKGSSISSVGITT